MTETYTKGHTEAADFQYIYSTGEAKILALRDLRGS